MILGDQAYRHNYEFVVGITWFRNIWKLEAAADGEVMVEEPSRDL